MRCDGVSQMARYIAVGASLFAIDYGVFYFLSQYLGFAIATAQLASRSTGAAVGFMAHRNVTFRSTQSGMRLATQGVKYTMVLLFTLLISPILVIFFMHLFTQNSFYAKISTEIILTTTSFGLQRLVFNPDEALT
jgi:putative flippase GtrA